SASAPTSNRPTPATKRTKVRRSIRYSQSYPNRCFEERNGLSQTRMSPRRLIAVIATIVTFRHTEATYDRARLEAISHSTAPKYRGKPGLVTKTYWYDDTAREHGGIYLWTERRFA